VGASAANGVRVNFSNYGPNLSLLAPGAFADDDCHEGIYLPLPPVAFLFDGNTCIRFVTDDEHHARYAYLRGTSFAAPEVAGAAALLWAARPDLKSFEVATLLQHGSVQAIGTGWNPVDGWGVLDVARSLELATGKSAADRIELSQPRGRAAAGAGRRVTQTATLNWGDGVAVDVSTTVCTATIDGAPAQLLVQSFEQGTATCAWSTPKSAAGQTLAGTIGVTEPQTNLSVSKPFATRLDDVTRPKVKALAGAGRFNGVVPLHFVASDETGSVSVRLRVYRGAKRIATAKRTAASGATSVFGWRAPRATTTPFKFCVTATDKAGNVSASSCAPIRLS
jgi:hypothetical protein